MSISSRSNIGAYLILRGKAMGDQSGDLIDVFQDMLLKAKLDDKERFRQLALESRAGAESALRSAGHR